MRARNADDIRRLALSRGVEADIGGRSFNTTGDRVRGKPAETVKPADPTGLSREDVIRIAADMVAESEKRTALAISEQAQAMTIAIAKALREIPPPAPGMVVDHQKLHVDYDDADRITNMTITPTYRTLQ